MHDLGADPPLTEQEPHFIGTALIQCRSAASNVPLPIHAFRFSDWTEFDTELNRSRDAIARRGVLSDRDWGRALLLTEIAWCSDLIGTGTEFALVNGIPDDQAITLLRSIQRKISNSERAALVFPSGGRPNPGTTSDESTRSSTHSLPRARGVVAPRRALHIRWRCHRQNASARR